MTASSTTRTTARSTRRTLPNVPRCGTGAHDPSVHEQRDIDHPLRSRRHRRGTTSDQLNDPAQGAWGLNTVEVDDELEPEAFRRGCER